MNKEILKSNKFDYKEKLIDKGRKILRYGKGIGAAAALAALGNPDMTAVVHAQPDRVSYVQGQSFGGFPKYNPDQQGMIAWNLADGNQTPLKFGRCDVVLTEGGPVQTFFLLPDGSPRLFSTAGGVTQESYLIERIGDQPSPANMIDQVWNTANFIGKVDQTVRSLSEGEDLISRATDDQTDRNVQKGDVFTIDVKYAIVVNGVLLESGLRHPDRTLVPDFKSDQPFPDCPPKLAPTAASAPVALAPASAVESLPIFNKAPRGILPLSVKYIEGVGFSGIASRVTHLRTNEIALIFGQSVNVAGLQLDVDSVGDPSLSQIVAIINKGGEYDEGFALNPAMGYWAGKELSLGADKIFDLHAAAETQANRAMDPSLGNCLPGGCGKIITRGLNRTSAGYEKVFEEKWVR